MGKRILILANNATGLYQFRKELIQRLIENKFEVYISLPYEEKVEEMVEWGCVFIDTIVDRRGTNPIKDFKLILHYWGIIKKWRPSIILAYTIKPNLYGGLVCRLLRIPCINNVTGLGSGFGKSGLLKWLIHLFYKLGLKKSACIFFQNQSDMSLLLSMGIVKGNYQLIPGSGVNLNEHKFEEYPDDDGTIRFLFIGRLLKEKGIGELIQAARQVKQRHSIVSFDLVGPCEEEYETTLQELNHDHVVNLLGQQNDIHNIIAVHHVTVHPSYSEGMSNALLESAATGRPVLASKISGCLETFDEGKTGFGFQAKNVADLVRAIEHFIQLPYNEKREMGRMAREKMEREFNRDIVVQAYLVIINQVV